MKIAKTTNQLRKKGFTLIEVIIVIAILGTLTAVAVPSYNALQNNSTAKVCAETRQAFVNQLVSDRKLDGTGVEQNFKTLSAAGTYKCPGNGTYTLNISTDQTFTINCSEHGATLGEFTGDMTLVGSAAGSAATEVPKESVVDPTTPEPEPPTPPSSAVWPNKKEPNIKLDNSGVWPDWDDYKNMSSDELNRNMPTVHPSGIFGYVETNGSVNFYVVYQTNKLWNKKQIQYGPSDSSLGNNNTVVKVSDFALSSSFPTLKAGDTWVNRNGGQTQNAENNYVYGVGPKIECGDIIRDSTGRLYIFTNKEGNYSLPAISNFNDNMLHIGDWYRLPLSTGS